MLGKKILLYVSISRQALHTSSIIYVEIDLILNISLERSKSSVEGRLQVICRKHFSIVMQLFQTKLALSIILKTAWSIVVAFLKSWVKVCQCGGLYFQWGSGGVELHNNIAPRADKRSRQLCWIERCGIGASNR